MTSNCFYDSISLRFNIFNFIIWRLYSLEEFFILKLLIFLMIRYCDKNYLSTVSITKLFQLKPILIIINIKIEIIY